MATFKVTIEIGTPDQSRFEKLEAVDLKKVSVKNDAGESVVKRHILNIILLALRGK